MGVITVARSNATRLPAGQLEEGVSMSANFHLAPPPKTVDGLMAVPIDIESIEAVFTFDGAAETVSADATITYTVGPTAGNPIFDLRQDITQAWLDGVLFSVAQLAHHNFGVGGFTDLRVIEAVQAAGSVHTLRVQYNLSLPNSQLGGSYLPALEWSAGPKLRFVFGLSDLNRARYAEAWLPANLVFDQFSINLEIQIINTMAAHSVITNGAVTSLGLNHWQISFPARFSAVSPLLEVRASDTLAQQTDTVLLPVSGKTVTIETWRLTSSVVNLTAQINNIKTLLADNENDYGAYLHDERFVTFFNGTGGMEYEGGTTTATGALPHETFHSWFARGIKPASQADGWWDEGFTSFHDDGAADAVPFDFSDPPALLCSRDPWQRHTPPNSYTDGSTFWKGMASLLGVSTLNALMGDLYETYKGNPVSTQMIEEFLLCKSGNAQVVDCFHRFVYGLADTPPAPDLWIRDDPAHGGADQWGGAFWDSPDLWIRNADDGGAIHQPPEYGQDNWFYARVRNKAGAGGADHFVVTFHSRGFAGTQFVYPADFLPCIAAKAEFVLAPDNTRIVKARWPRTFVPPAGSHTCLLASVITRGDHPTANRRIWEHNNLAQKNLTVVDLLPNTFMILPIVIANWRRELDPRFDLEVWLPREDRGINVSLIHRSKEFFRLTKTDVKQFKPEFTKSALAPQQTRLECGGYIPDLPNIDKGRIMTSDTPELALGRFPDSWEAGFPKGGRARMPVEVSPFTQKVVGLKVAIPAQAKIGQSLKLHFVQRHLTTQQIVGGVAVQVNVGARTSKSDWVSERALTQPLGRS
jgi:hypothetical protein